jgi:hypothetical protein
VSAPNFGELFVRSKGQPITHQGRTLVMQDRFPEKLGQRFTVTIESTKSKFPQGIGISKGVEVFGQRVERAVTWEYFSIPPEERSSLRSRLPFSFEVVCRNKQGWVSFYNMTGFEGRQEWWSGGSCMIVTEIPAGRRYQCNDFEVDDDFDDLVFAVTPLHAEELR